MKSIRLFLVLFLFVIATSAQAAYTSRFDAINFKPAVDGGDYFMVYGSQTLQKGIGHTGLYLDYADRPLEFKAILGGTGRQSVLDGTLTINTYGSIGLTDWWTVGLNIPSVAYNWFFTDDASATEDHGGGMGDLLVMTKFRLLDVSKTHVGLALIPYFTLPTGDIIRYNGNGHVTGGLKLALDAQLHDRLSVALNAGGVLRDDVTRTFALSGGGTASISIDDLFTYGGAVNVNVVKNLDVIAEVNGYTEINNMFASNNTSPLEAGAGVKYAVGDSGFTLSLAGTGGLIDGVGSPRYRALGGVSWTSTKKECPKCPELPPPDARIRDNKIVLWGKIFYDTDKTTIREISFPVLDDVVKVLNDHPEILMVEVQGHTDARATDEYNLKLSQGRAESAMNYLVQHGVAPERLTAKGYGESRPIATNDTVEGMSQNRRTEFVIVQSNDGFTTNPSAEEAAPSVPQAAPDGSVSDPASAQAVTPQPEQPVVPAQ